MKKEENSITILRTLVKISIVKQKKEHQGCSPTLRSILQTDHFLFDQRRSIFEMSWTMFGTWQILRKACLCCLLSTDQNVGLKPVAFCCYKVLLVFILNVCTSGLLYIFLCQRNPLGDSSILPTTEFLHVNSLSSAIWWIMETWRNPMVKSKPSVAKTIQVHLVASFTSSERSGYLFTFLSFHV